MIGSTSRGLALGAGLLLGACSTGPVPPLPDGSQLMDWHEIMAARGSAESLHAVLSDTTSSRYLTTGTRVDYLAPDGRTFFWLPGLLGPAVGRWEVRPLPDGRPEFCAWLGPSEPSRYDCSVPGDLVGDLYETVRGDVFDLSSGTLPFVMPPGRAMSFNRLMLIRSGELSLSDFQ